MAGYGTFDDETPKGLPGDEPLPSRPKSGGKRSLYRERAPLLSGIRETTEEATDLTDPSTVEPLNESFADRQSTTSILTDASKRMGAKKGTGMKKSVSIQDFQAISGDGERSRRAVFKPGGRLAGLAKEWGGENEEQLERTEGWKDIEVNILLGKNFRRKSFTEEFAVPKSPGKRMPPLIQQRSPGHPTITANMMEGRGSDAMRIRLRYFNAIDSQLTNHPELGRSSSGSTLYHRRRLSNMIKIKSRENLAALDVSSDKIVTEISPLIVPTTDFGRVVEVSDILSINGDEDSTCKSKCGCCVIQ
mmetsp:Transcript_37563/g.96932  ORF Transcript_37563/g.96932 Transcript_37563/m.96932 type:complete len:304 (-) Transcript_37563:424-1335(-)